MGRPRSGLGIHGILLLDKPAGRSSNQAMQVVRRALNARKAGHTGNLDPFATGMLPICFGEATKTASYMLDADKSYLATARLGVATSTGDVEGEVVRESSIPSLSRTEIESAMDGFRGQVEQIPPMHSALKHQGRPLYELAREGKTVERVPRTVTIHDIRLESWAAPMLTFRVDCSKGTYVRTLAEDLAGALGTCAHLQSLRRLWVSPFDPSGMHSIDEVLEAVENSSQDKMLLPIDAGLTQLKRVEIDPGQANRFCHGNPVPVEWDRPGTVRVYDEEGILLGLGEVLPNKLLRPKRLFRY